MIFIALCLGFLNMESNFSFVNTSLNNREATDDKNSLNAFDKTLVALFSFIFVFGVLGNSLTIYVYYVTFKRKLVKYEILILMLSIVDLMSSVVNPLLFIYMTVVGYQRWDFGIVGCKLLPYTGPVFTSCSCGIILIMSIDRDRAIASPMKQPFKLKTVYTAVVVTVFLSLATYFWYACGLTVMQSGNGQTCNHKGSRTAAYSVFTIAILSGADGVFMAIFTITSSRIFFKLYERKKFHQSVDVIVNSRTEKALKPVRILVSVGVVFLLCIFPRDIFHVYYNFRRLIPPAMPDSRRTFEINALVKALHTANCCVNVVIYSLVNLKFRRKIKETFCRPFFRKSLHEMDSSTTVSSSEERIQKKLSLKMFSPAIVISNRCRAESTDDLIGETP